MRSRCQGGHKAITPSVHRLDEAKPVAPVPHGLANAGDTAGQRPVTHICIRPALGKEFVPGHHPVTMLEQVVENLEPLGLQGDYLPPTSQFLARII